MVVHRVRHVSDALRDVLGPMLPTPSPPGATMRGGRPSVPNLACLGAVIDVARGTRWRDIRRASHGVSCDTVLQRLRFWTASGVPGGIMDLLKLRGVLGRTQDGATWTERSTSGACRWTAAASGP